MQLKKNNFNSQNLKIFLFKVKSNISNNLDSLFLCCQIFGKELIKTKNSSIINIGSTYGVVGPDQSIYKIKNKKQIFFKSPSYPTTKGAIISFTKYLASYWGHKSLRVNTVSPGGIFNNNKNSLKKYSKNFVNNVKREEISNVIVFLCRINRYMTGSNILVDGGWTII